MYRILFSLLFCLSAFLRADIVSSSFVQDGQMTSGDEIRISCKELFSGKGSLQAPRVHIATKKFEFTGTISCSDECVITVEEPCNEAMFSRSGGGTFRIIHLQLIPAIKNKDVEKIKQLLASNVGINEKDAHGSSAFSYAIEACDGTTPATDIVRMLVECAPALVNESLDDYGFTPLMLASNKGRVDLVELLIKAGARKDAVDKQENSALFYALLNAKEEAIVLLNPAMEELDKSFKSVFKTVLARQYYWLEQGMTPLMWAANKGLKKLVQFLLDHGADRKVQDASRRTAIDYARMGGSGKEVEEIVAMLSDRADTRDVDSKNDHPTGIKTEETDKASIDNKSTTPSYSSNSVVGISLVGCLVCTLWVYYHFFNRRHV